MPYFAFHALPLLRLALPFLLHQCMVTPPCPSLDFPTSSLPCLSHPSPSLTFLLLFSLAMPGLACSSYYFLSLAYISVALVLKPNLVLPLYPSLPFCYLTCPFPTLTFIQFSSLALLYLAYSSLALPCCSYPNLHILAICGTLLALSGLPMLSFALQTPLCSSLALPTTPLP